MEVIMDRFMENKFGYLRKKSDEELEEFLNETNKDVEYWESVYKDPNSRSFQKTEAAVEENYSREKVLYVENLLEERKKHR